MTVRELIEALEQQPAEAEVILAPLIRTEPLSNISYDAERNEVELS
jgi:hypothetical protein